MAWRGRQHDAVAPCPLEGRRPGRAPVPLALLPGTQAVEVAPDGFAHGVLVALLLHAARSFSAGARNPAQRGLYRRPSSMTQTVPRRGQEIAAMPISRKRRSSMACRCPGERSQPLTALRAEANGPEPQ